MIALIGAPGSGKSSVGAALAVRLGVPFVDVDTEVDVAGTVLESGSEALRQAALDVVLRAPADAVVAVSSVIAGGDDAMEALAPAWTVYLASDLAHTFPRSGMSGPQLLGMPARQIWHRLLSERDPGYRSLADAVVEVGQRDVNGVTDAVAETLPGR